MSKLMAVLLNDIAQLEYDREKPLTEYQRTYLDEMDKKMEQGIEIDGVMMKDPDASAKAQFVVANLLDAMKQNNEGLTSALCTYLADRQPDLKQIKIKEVGEEASIEFVYDEDYKGQAKVDFVTH